MIIKNNYHKEKPKIKITVNKNIQEFGKRRKIENNIYNDSFSVNKQTKKNHF